MPPFGSPVPRTRLGPHPVRPVAVALLTRPRVRLALCLAVCLLTLSCADAQRPTGAAAFTVDTLPGGAVRTMSSAPSEAGRWRLVPLQTIQPAEGEPGELIAPNDIALTMDGRIAVAESTPSQITLFSADGTFLRTFGRDGAGPGEFRAAWIATRGDTLFVQDPQLSRASTFLLSSGALLGTYPTSGFYWAPIGVDGAGRAVVRLIRDNATDDSSAVQSFLRMSFDGTRVDTVSVPIRTVAEGVGEWTVREGDQVRMTVRVPMQPRDEQRTDPNGDFVAAWTGEYLLRDSRTGRDTVALFGRSFAALPITPAEKEQMVEDRMAEMSAMRGGPPASVLRAAFTTDRIPAVRPPFDAFAVDVAGRVWVRRELPASDSVTFDLFGTDRRWLDEVRVATREWPSETWAGVAWGHDRVAVLLEGEDGRPLVRLFSIVRAD